MISRRIRMVALLVLSVAFTSGLSAQGTPPQPPQISTSGQGEVRVVPDRATVMVSVQTKAPTAQAAAAANAATQRAVLDTLRAIGFGSDQLSTSDYSVSPQYDRSPNMAAAKPAAYLVSNTVVVEVRHIDQIGSVIDAALTKGANSIEGVRFTVSTEADARRAALADAVARAKADAEVMAKAAGGSLGPLLELTSSEPGVRPMFSMANAKMAGAMATPIEPGEQTITATVTARWVFVPKISR